MLTPCVPAPRKRGRPRLPDSARGRPSKRKTITLTEREILALLKTPSYPKQYVSCRSGSMQVFLHEHTYEFVCNRNGNHYYRCIEKAANDCAARILVRGSLVYIIDDKHSHSEKQTWVVKEEHQDQPLTTSVPSPTVVNVTGRSSALGEIVKIMDGGRSTATVAQAPKLLNKMPPTTDLKARMASKLHNLQLSAKNTKN